MAGTVRFVAVSLCAILAVATGTAQTFRTLSIDDIYNPTRRVDFSGGVQSSLTWLDPQTYVTTRRGNDGVEWILIDADTGRSSPLFDAGRMEAALASLPGVTRQEAGRLARSSTVVFNRAHTVGLVTIDDDLYSYDLPSATARRLTTTDGEEELGTFSPDGRFVAFVRANDLFVVEVTSGRETALTSDGSPQLLNGKLDWLYQEEIYGRGQFRGFWWSPDSSRIALLQLDESRVPDYTVVDDIPYRPRLEVTPYPKAGDANPTVKLGLAEVADGTTAWIDLSPYEQADVLVVNVGWAPDSARLTYQVQNREQTWLDLNAVEVASGRTRRLLRETTPAWVNENGNPVWLRDGTFLWFSERSGFRHLYRSNATLDTVLPITSGRWDVRTLYGVDEASGAAFFAAGQNPIGTDIYRIGLDGTGLARLSQGRGTSRAIFNTDFTRYVGVWSDVTTPSQLRLHRSDGSEVRIIDANPVGALREFRLATPEFVQVAARDGFPMEAVLIKPLDFDSSRRYPVYQLTYAGPGAARVRDQWGGTEYLFHQLLAQHGVVVWILDNRSASGKGAESQWPVHGRLGELELQDLEDGVGWLKGQEWVDPTRILLSGWSYGGFMTAYAMTHSSSWSAGIVGAPVTDWRDYDTIYTERLMKLPSQNAEGYVRTAPRFAADRVRGPILLIHGTMDDNVHMQNSMQFAYELQKAGKPFELMVYPRSRHAIEDGRLNLHMRQLMFDFVMRAIGTGSGQPGSSR